MFFIDSVLTFHLVKNWRWYCLQCSTHQRGGYQRNAEQSESGKRIYETQWINLQKEWFPSDIERTWILWQRANLYVFCPKIHCCTKVPIWFNEKMPIQIVAEKDIIQVKIDKFGYTLFTLFIVSHYVVFC